MRYFFHIRTETGLIPDGEGIELTGLEQVKEEALTSAKELATEFPPGSEGVSLKSVEVVDEALHTVFCAPIF
jgi:hypothetical protein